MTRFPVLALLLASFLLARGLPALGEAVAPSGTLRGVVLDPEGRPLAGAVVFSELGLATTHAVTDSSGRFELHVSARPDHEADVYVRAKGLRTALVRGPKPDGEELRVQLQKLGPFRVTGRVNDPQGKPLAGTRLLLERRDQRSGQAALSQAQSDAEGRFAFAEEFQPTSPDDSQITLVAIEEKHAVWVRRLDATGGDADVTVKLSEPIRLVGRVVDEGGIGLEGTRVRLRTAGWNPLPQERGEWVPEAITDEDGRFELGSVPPGTHVGLTASHRGFATEYVYGIDTGWTPPPPPPGAERVVPTVRFHPGEEILVTMRQATVVRGTLTYEGTQKPAAGVRIATQSHRHSNWSETLTDADGRFELPDLAPVPCNLLVMTGGPRDQSPEWTAAAVELFALKAGEVTEVSLTLTKGVTVSGHVRDKNGRPLKGIGVAFYSAARPRSGAACESTRTGADGSWSYRFPPGPLYVYVQGRNPDLPNRWLEGTRQMGAVTGSVEGVDFVFDEAVPDGSPHFVPDAPAEAGR